MTFFVSYFSLIISNIAVTLYWLKWRLWWGLMHTNRHGVFCHTYSAVWWHTGEWRWEPQCWDQESCSEPLHYTFPCCLHGRRCKPSQWGCRCCSAWGSRRRWSPREPGRRFGEGGCSWLDVSGCQQCYLRRRKFSWNIIGAPLQCTVCQTLHTAKMRIKITLLTGWMGPTGSDHLFYLTEETKREDEFVLQPGAKELSSRAGWQKQFYNNKKVHCLTIHPQPTM